MAAILMPSFAPAILDVFGVPVPIAIIFFVLIVATIAALVAVGYLTFDEYRVKRPKPRRTNRSAGELIDKVNSLEKRIGELNEENWTLRNKLRAYEEQHSTAGGASRSRSTVNDSSGITIGRHRDLRDDRERRPVSSEVHHDSGVAWHPDRGETQAAELCRRYNEGVHNGSMRTAFREKYRITRISTTNVDERRRNPNLTPEYNTSNSGEFFVVELQQGGRVVYAAVPQFDLEINELRHGPGAVGEVFDCRGYQPGGSYHSITVVRPAYFTRESDSGWKLDKPGTLDVT